MQNNATQCKVMRSSTKQSDLIKIKKPKHSTCDTGSMLHMLLRSLLVCALTPAGYTAKPQTQQTHGCPSRETLAKNISIGARRLRRVSSLEQDACQEYYHGSNHFASSSEEAWNHSHRTSPPNPRKRRVRRGERCFYEKGISTIDCQ